MHTLPEKITGNVVQIALVNVRVQEGYCQIFICYHTQVANPKSNLIKKIKPQKALEQAKIYVR